jgi:hypothetical protein
MSNLDENRYYSRKKDGGCYRILDAHTQCQHPDTGVPEPAVEYLDVQKSSAYCGQRYVTPTWHWLDAFEPATFQDSDGNPISNPPPGWALYKP